MTQPKRLHPSSYEWPPENPGAPTRNSILAVAILAVLTLLVINGIAKWYLEDHTINRGYWIVTQKSKVLASTSGGPHFLVLGDSSGNFGIIPSQLKAAIGLEEGVVNLCTIADMLTLDDYYLLKQYVADHGRPTGVLIVHTYNAWPRQGSLGAFARSSWPIDWIAHDLKLDPIEIHDLRLRRYFPLYSENTTIKRMVLMPRSTLMGYAPYGMQPDGYMAIEEPSPGVMRDVRLHLKQVRSIPAIISRPNQDGITAIGNLADEMQFDVYWVFSPLFEGLWEDPVFRKYFSRIDKQLRELLEPYERMRVLPFDRGFLFEADEMENADHVIASAAKRYTRHVGSLIRINVAGEE